MELLIYSLQNYPPDWNQFLLENDTGTIHNTVEYAKYSINEGLVPKFVQIIDSKGEILLQVILYEYKHQPTMLPKLVGKVVKIINVRAKWSYGPIYTSDDALQYFFNFLNKQRIKFYGITHPFTKCNNFRFKNQRWGTFLLDLKKPKEEIYQHIDKKSARKNVERSIERGIEIENINNENLYEYYDLFNQTKKESNRMLTTTEQMESFWNLLKPIGFSGFIARKDGICVGGILFSFFNKYMNEWGVARSKIDYEEKLYSQDLIKWKIIEWGIDNHMNWYDFSGHNPEPKNEKERGILQYKKKWGGEEYTQWIIKS
jgi:lipid II:glycine glycyltransferase (peptidoglycan interpeptide bridge formation enzyme)